MFRNLHDSSRVVVVVVVTRNDEEIKHACRERTCREIDGDFGERGVSSNQTPNRVGEVNTRESRRCMIHRRGERVTPRKNNDKKGT
jgi:hypothetical protein